MMAYLQTINTEPNTSSMKAKIRIQRHEQITSITAYYCPLRIAKFNPVCSYTSES